MNILFVYAHMDDETFMSYGAMRRLSSQHSVNLLTFCGEGRKGEPDVKARKAAWTANTSFINKAMTCPLHDLQLDASIVKEKLSQCMEQTKPDWVFTHSPYDNHFEHRLVSNEVLLQCRVNGESSPVSALFFTALPSNVQTFGQLGGSYQPNMFMDISQYHVDKINAIAKYAVAGIIPIDKNDIRSHFAYSTADRMNGFAAGCGYAESYQQIFMVM